MDMPERKMLSETEDWLFRELEYLPEEPTDVRLVHCGNGTNWIQTGLVDYDIVHGIACGAGELGKNALCADVYDLARDLVNQVCDQLAEMDS